MPFKTGDFKNKEFLDNTAQIRLNDLQKWFDGEPVWTVRGLTAHELDQADYALKVFLSVNKDHTLFPDTIKKTIHLSQASIDPIIDADLAQKMADAYPIEFNQLVYKILELTGQGKV